MPKRRVMTDNLKWTDDCQGKKNYDGALISVSSRFYPRGGGFTIFDRGKGFEENDSRPEIKPSAVSSIILPDESVLFSKEFEAETEEEVKAQVEEWVEEKYCEILAEIRRGRA